MSHDHHPRFDADSPRDWCGTDTRASNGDSYPSLFNVDEWRRTFEPPPALRVDTRDTDRAPPPDPYPTLHAIGLGPALDAVERVCAWAQNGKHVGPKWRTQTVDLMSYKLTRHLGRGLYGKETADEDTGEHPFAHVAARALMLLGLVLKK